MRGTNGFHPSATRIGLMAIALLLSSPVFAQGNWTTKAPIPTARYGLAAGVIDSVLYAVGGANRLVGPLSTLEAYDLKTNSWTERASMSTRRVNAAAAVLDGVLYVAGGLNAEEEE